MELRDILVRPLITEKTTTHLGGEQTYAFEVSLVANKLQIKKAIERFYGVSVAQVRTTIVRGKIKRWGRHWSKRGNWKKAYVKLAEGSSLNLYQSEA